MRIQSPLSNLCDVLVHVRSSATRYEATLRKNEAATRAVLIDPILRALGWDTSNTYMVEVEKTLSQTRVDYALDNQSSDVKVIIEAKPLGEDLNHPSIFFSLLKYAFTYKIQDIFLTDGLNWRHFTNFDPQSTEATNVLNIAADDPVECAAYLVQRLDAAKFWPEEQTIDTLTQQVAQLESTVAVLQQTVAAMQSSTPSTAPDVEYTPTPSAEDNHAVTASFVDLDKLGSVKGKKPSLLRLPDGSAKKVRAWSQFLIEYCKFSLDHNKSITIPLPDKSGRNTMLLSIVEPDTNRKYEPVQYNGRKIYIYAIDRCIAG